MDGMKVIAISGHARNGKDTVARILEKQLQKDGYSRSISIIWNRSA